VNPLTKNKNQTLKKLFYFILKIILFGLFGRYINQSNQLQTKEQEFLKFLKLKIEKFLVKN
jgi:hypothetical protein